MNWIIILSQCPTQSLAELIQWRPAKQNNRKRREGLGVADTTDTINRGKFNKQRFWYFISIAVTLTWCYCAVPAKQSISFDCIFKPCGLKTSGINCLSTISREREYFGICAQRRRDVFWACTPEMCDSVITELSYIFLLHCFVCLTAKKKKEKKVLCVNSPLSKCPSLHHLCLKLM